MPEVRVTAADYNPRAKQPFDGCPFTDVPTWLVDAGDRNLIRPVTPGSTDYAEWEVTTLSGVRLASPGDWISIDVNGDLHVRKFNEAI